MKAMLTVDETWAQKQEKSIMKDEEFRRINFWRRMLRQAEITLASE